MSTVHHMRIAQGYRPFTNPRRAMLGAIGASLPAPVCLDQAQNSIDCQSPDCTYGDCGATSPGGAGAAYSAIQQGSFGIFGAAWPWLLALGAMLWLKRK
jgi:hypothetical protein